MAKNHPNRSTEETAAETGNGTPLDAPENRQDGWAKVQTDRGVYSGERGKGGSVCGYMLGVLDMPPVLGKPWQAIVFRLTEPCKAKRNDAEYTAQPGDEILVPMNHQLRQHLARAACNPQVIAEVSIRPEGTRKTDAGTMTVWDIRVNPQLVKRQPHDRLLAMNAAGPALPPPGGAGQGTASDDDIPF